MVANKRGCFCFNLRTAAFFHGWINITVLIVLICITIKQIFYNNPDDMLIEMYKLKMRTYHRLQVLSLVVYIFDFFLTALLIGGITIKIHYLFLPWMVFRAIGLIIVTPLVILTMVFAGVILKAQMIVVSLIYALIVVLFIWTWIITYSLYGEIRKTLKNPLPMSSTVPYYEHQKRQLGPSSAGHNQFYAT